MPTLALLTGGFPEAELREAGAVAVLPSLSSVRERGVEWVLGFAR